MLNKPLAASSSRSSDRQGTGARPDFGRRSLVGRLVALAAVWSILLLVGMGVALTLLFDHAALSRFDTDLADLANGLYAGAGVEADGAVTAPSLTDERATRAYSGKYWQIADYPADGRLHALARSRSLWDQVLNAPHKVMVQLQAAPGTTAYYNTVGPAQDGHEPLRAAALLAFLPGHAAPVVFMAAENRAPLNRDVRRFAWTTAAALVLLGVGLVGAVVVQVVVGLTPLFAMRREVAGVRQGKAQRLAGAYPRELAPLASELNALLDHNQEVVERQRTHVGNLAHALKTPISVMLAEADRDPSPLAAVVDRQAETMRRQVEHHLRRARAAARSQGSGERTPVAEVLDELARTLQRIFQARGVDVDWEAEEGLAFLGERQDLQEIAGNLLENACRFCRGRVRVNAEPAAPGRLQLTVEDDGPGLDEAQSAEVLKRGARLDESAPGSGLGLSIVDELARAYGGSLTLSRSSLGGLRVDLDLPRAEA
ncbi:sensor histidine kinase [Caulobacter sp. S45]|uniref:sensor histidine kinase n=1 Tax=Caulobacter sp. S45 TaxID=1641861 RepID=UPI001576159B|nr:ATP-binding protein [Caulobacter sp. S45]